MAEGERPQDGWPDGRSRYDRHAVGDDAQGKWQQAVEAALRAGSLRLEPTDSPQIVTLRGACPRCGHQLMGVDIYREVLLGVAPANDDQWAIINLICDCLESHEGRPQERSGCGWAPSLTVAIEWPQPGAGHD
jgi:hypothetical protein